MYASRNNTAPAVGLLFALLFLASEQSTLAAPAGPAASSGVATDGARAHSRYLELRAYRTQDGQRDRFLGYFEEHYLESQEEAGMRIWGQFRDLGDAGRMVWMRGYRSMEERSAALMKFYTSAHWQQTSPPLAEMIANTSHVRFLEPVSDREGLDDRFDRDAGRHSAGVIVAQVFPVDQDAGPLIEQLRGLLIPAYREGGGVSLGLFESSAEENNVPQLPFIEDERVLVWLGSFPDRAAYESVRKEPQLRPTPVETFVLEPGPRSRLYHRGN